MSILKEGLSLFNADRLIWENNQELAATRLHTLQDKMG